MVALVPSFSRMLQLFALHCDKKGDRSLIMCGAVEYKSSTHVRNCRLGRSSAKLELCLGC